VYLISSGLLFLDKGVTQTWGILGKQSSENRRPGIRQMSHCRFISRFLLWSQPYAES
jgi:hypothetical protein